MIALTTGEKVFRAFNTVFLTLCGIITFYPFIYILVLSLNEGLDSARGGIFLWPRAFTLYNFESVLKSSSMQKAYVITLGRTVLGTSLALAVNGFAAYALTFTRLPGRKFLMVYLIIPMIFNGGLIPYFLQLYKLGLVNTFWVYIFPTLVSVWNIFVMRAYFAGIPESLREAAEIDGAGHFKIFFRIILPISLPTFAAIGLFTAVWHWNDWFSGAFFVRKLDLVPVQTLLQRLFVAQNSALLGGQAAAAESAYRNSQVLKVTFTSIRMATVMVGTLPILLAYPFVQKYFVKGVLLGSIKD